MIRVPVPRIAGVSMVALALAMPVALSPMLASPALALFGFGRIVYDPSNYAQNVLTAARTLEQINNQIRSLQNEAQMLINQARNLASLPYSALQQIQQNVSRTQQLLNQAQNIAFEVQSIDQAFQSQYGSVSLSTTDQQLVADARARWENTVGGLQDALRVQAGVVGNIDTNRAELAALIGQSQNAAGALQATQAGNQLLALQSDPPPLNGSTLKYGFDHEGGPQWQTSDTSPTRSSRSFGRLRFCAAKAWRWRMPFARSAFPN